VYDVFSGASAFRRPVHLLCGFMQPAAPNLQWNEIMKASCNENLQLEPVLSHPVAKILLHILTFPPCCATGLPTAGVWICRLISSRFGMHRRNLFRHRLLWLHRNWWCFQNQSKVLIIIKKVLFVCKETLNLLWTNKLLYTASVSRGYGRNRKHWRSHRYRERHC